MPFLTINTETETVRDLDLAQALGYGRPDNIRNLIKKKLPMLAQFGDVAAERSNIAMPRGGTKEVTEFHLNRKQAIYLTTQAFAFLDSLEPITAPWATNPPAPALRVPRTP